MSLRQQNDAAKSLAPQRQSGCAAHGCPMPGSITHTTKAGDSSEWVCRFHFNEPIEDWNRITTRVRAMTQEERKTMVYLPAIRKMEAV